LVLVSYVFSFDFGFYIVTSEPRLLFGTRTNVLLSEKAETAFETRQVFSSSAVKQKNRGPLPLFRLSTASSREDA